MRQVVEAWVLHRGWGEWVDGSRARKMIDPILSRVAAADWRRETPRALGPSRAALWGPTHRTASSPDWRSQTGARCRQVTAAREGVRGKFSQKILRGGAARTPSASPGMSRATRQLATSCHNRLISHEMKGGVV